MKCTSEHDHHIVMRFLLTWSAQMVPIMEFGSNQVVSCQTFSSTYWRLPVSLHVHDMYLYLYIDIVYQYHGLLIV